MNEICGDNRFEIIAKAKADLLESTNIETDEAEMAVIDNILFRCWQMGWLDRYADCKTENSSGKPNNCEPQKWTKENCKGCKYNEYPYDSGTCFVRVCINGNKYEPKDEPQTDTEIAKAIVHKMIDDSVIAEDAYPDLRQKMHDAVDEYEPQTEREGE